MASKTTLQPKQARFVAEYLLDLNASAAYKRAGYIARGNSAEVNACQLLRNPKVKAEIAKAMQKREERTHITQDRVLQELARIAFFDIRKLYTDEGALKRPDQLDDDAAAVLSAIEVVEKESVTTLDEDDEGNPVRKIEPQYTKKARVFDKGAALTLAMRHLGMLVDRTELTGPKGGPLQIIAGDMTPQEAAAAYAATVNDHS